MNLMNASNADRQLAFLGIRSSFDVAMSDLLDFAIRSSVNLSSELGNLGSVIS